MKLWMGGELWHEAAASYRHARNQIEPAINSVIASKDYGAGVKEWAYIAIIGASEGYDEVSKYSKRSGVFEFRLRIPLDEFLQASESKQIQLICISLAKSLSLMSTTAPLGFQSDLLYQDFLRVMSSNDWSAA